MLYWAYNGNKAVGYRSICCRRRPAWCDRILYKAPKTEYKNVALVTEQTSYRSHPAFNISDHKPVTSEFTIQVRIQQVSCVFVFVRSI